MAINDKRIFLKLDDEIFNWVREKAKETGVPSSTFIRILLKREYNVEHGLEPFVPKIAKRGNV